jgi:ankyrin repeat protein
MYDLHNIYKSAQNGNLSFFQEHINEKLFKETVFISSYAKSGDTVLHYAVRHGHFDLVKYLVDEGFNLELGNFDGKRPLHEAAHFGQAVCLKFLLTKDVNVDALKRADW